MIHFGYLALVLTGITAQGPQTAPTCLRVNLLRHPEAAVITDSNLSFSWVVNDSRHGAMQSTYQIELDHADGKLVWSTGRVKSGDSTQVYYAGPKLKSDRYQWRVRTGDKAGQFSPWSKFQHFDLRLDSPGAKPRLWPSESRWVETSTGHVLENRQHAAFSPSKQVTVKKLDGDRWVCDFGKAAFGTFSFGLSTNYSGPLTVRLGERSSGDGGVDSNVGRSSIGYIQAAAVAEKGVFTVNLPRHVGKYPHSQSLPEFMPEVMPFRYAEIRGIPVGTQPINAVQDRLLYDFDEDASEFSCSDPRLQKVWDLCKYTLHATPFLSLYCDGNRERMPYEADSYIQQLGHASVDSEFTAARYTLEFLLNHASWPTEWQAHTIFMAWQQWMSTGDLSTARRYYALLREKALIGLEAKDGLISTRKGKANKEFLKRIMLEQRDLTDIVDWPAGERDGFVMTDFNSVVNAFHVQSVKKLAELAGAIGTAEDSGVLKCRVDELMGRFNEVFFDAARGIYRDGIGTDHASLHANLFPLAFGLVPSEHIPSVLAYVRSKGMACSVYASQYLLEALFDAGEPQAALDLMTANSNRSWLHMIDLGSTMTMEAWDEKFKPNLTWNHAWGSAPANIIPRKLFGIEPTEPGFAHVRIRPQFGNLKQAHIKLPTIRGPIIADWNAVTRSLTITLPANVKGDLVMPSKGRMHTQRVESGTTTFKI